MNKIDSRLEKMLSNDIKDSSIDISKIIKSEVIYVLRNYLLISNDDVEGLEKSYELQARAYNAILDIANKYQGKNVLIVTHSHFIKGLFTKISTDFTFTTPLYNASLNYFYVNDHKITKYVFNKRIAC